MQNTIVYASAEDAILIRLAETTECYNEAGSIHGAKHSALHALGRVLTGALLGASLMKNENDRFSIQINSKGDIENVSAIADTEGNVKALVDFQEDRDLPLPQALGEGVLRILKEGSRGDMYAGAVELQSGEIAQDLVTYYENSEQVPTFCQMEEELDENGTIRACGYLIQLLPFTPEEIKKKLKEDLETAPPLLALFTEEKPERILEKLLPSFHPELSREVPVHFHCDCTREIVEQAVLGSGAYALAEMIEEGEEVEAVCPFCHTSYRFSPDELSELLMEALGEIK